MQQQHDSVWTDAGMMQPGPLGADSSCDVCIIGAGVAGLLTAERLASRGMSIIVLEAAGIGSGETGRTTAHISSALDDRYSSLAKLHGGRGAALAAASHTAAIHRIEELARDLDCGWKRVDGYLVVNEHHRARANDLIQEEFHAAREAGVDVEPVSEVPEPWPRCGPALRFADQGQLHALKFLYGLAAKLGEQGVKMYTQTRAVKFRGGNDARIETERGHTVRCKHIVIATNTPVNDVVTIHTKQMGFQTYAMAFRVPKGMLPPLLLWDGLWGDDASYHYVRLYEGGASGGIGEEGSDDLLIVGGEDHKTGQGPEGPRGEELFRCLEEWTRRMFPAAGKVEKRWSGEVMEPADALGFIGRNPGDKDNVYIITGDSGHGWTHAAIGSILIPDLIMGHENIWSTLYDPARKSGLRASREYARENLNTFAQYSDWLRGGDVRDESKIAPGEGAIIREGLKYLAVYKDESGQCTRRSAVCPHLGGIVRWNAQEKTWDCPCHSSRFDRHGKVMHGPANSDLKPASASDEQTPGRDETRSRVQSGALHDRRSTGEARSRDQAER